MPRSEHDRQDFEGHQKHAELDFEATQMLLNSTLASDDTKGIMASYFAFNRDFSHYHKQMIRALLSGGLYLAPRIFKAGFTPSDNCPFCDSQESYEHVVYCCDAYNDERRLVDEHLEREPRASLFTGVAFKGPARTDLEASRTGRIFRPRITDKCSCDRVFTDGACSVGVLNSAGSGIFAEGKLNLSVPLVGHDHTAPRAELWAVIHAVEATVGNVEIASDCLYVINTATYLLRHGREGLRHLDNFDLWSIFVRFAKRIKVVLPSAKSKVMLNGGMLYMMRSCKCAKKAMTMLISSHAMRHVVCFTNKPMRNIDSSVALLCPFSCFGFLFFVSVMLLVTSKTLIGCPVLSTRSYQQAWSNAVCAVFVQMPAADSNL